MNQQQPEDRAQCRANDDHDASAASHIRARNDHYNKMEGAIGRLVISIIRKELDGRHDNTKG